MPARTLLRDLERQVDGPQLLSRPADLAAYAYDASGSSGERRLPDAVVFPGSTEEVAGVLQVCRYHGVPVVPRGAGTGYASGAVPNAGGVVLSLARMNRVLGLEADGMRMHVEAGCVTAAIHRRATAAGLYYPIDPISATTCTIGGNVATDAGGPHSLRHGTTADHVVGAVAVLSDGQVLRLGELGHGGDDLLRLLHGSEGTLAVVTEVLVALLPAPQARTTIAATFDGIGAAVDAGAAITAAGVVPTALELLDATALDAVTRAGAVAGVPVAGALVLAEVEGASASVRREAGIVREALQQAGATSVVEADDTAGSAHLWALRKAVAASVATLRVGNITTDVVVPYDRLNDLLQATLRGAAEHDVPLVVVGHLGEANLSTMFLLDPRHPGERQRAVAAVEAHYRAVLSMDGVLTAAYGVPDIGLTFVEQQLGPGGQALLRRLRTALDPAGILNPGRKVGLGHAVEAPVEAAAH